MIKQRLFWYLAWIEIIAAICLFTGTAYSQTSANYSIPWDVLEGGGGSGHSTNYLMLASIGQATAIGASASSQYKNYAGFEVWDNNVSDFVILTVADAQSKPGKTDIPVVIGLDNSATPVSSLQFRIKYDATTGIHAIGSGYRLAPRSQSFAASVMVAENGANSELLVLLYSLSGNAIAPGQGAILELLFRVDATATPGAASLLKFTQGIVADAAARPLPSQMHDTGTFTILSPCDPGDVNCDGAIDVLDLQALLNCIGASGSCERCDLNGDGQSNIFDVQLLINKINNPTGAVIPATTGAKPGVNGFSILSLPQLKLQPNTAGSFGVRLANDEPVAAGQLTFTYDAASGFDVTGVTLTSRTNGFDEPAFFKDARDPSNVKVLVLFFSLNGAVLTPGAGDILEFTYHTTSAASGGAGLTFTETLLANQSGKSAGPVETENGTVSIGEPVMHTITATANWGGNISPTGTIAVREHTELTLSMTPEPGYAIADVLVDGASVGAVAAYTFTDVASEHAIEAFFQLLSSGGAYLRDDWRDAEKSRTNPDDDWLCWAAAASNILDWAGWNTPLFDSAQDMFAVFQNYWTNAGGLMEYGWHWWFDGTQPPDWPGWAQLNQGWSNANNGGGYWSEYNFFDYFAEDWATWNADAGQWSDGAGLMTTLGDYLQSDYGVTLAVYNGNGGHALTAWGYEYDEFGAYTGVYVTDSDDYQTALKLLPVTLDAEQGLWRLGGEYTGWFIGGVEGLALRPEEAPVPEPGTLILLGFGLFGLIALKRRNFQARRK